MTHNLIPETSLPELVDNCTLEEVRALAVAALTAYAENALELDDAVDARMAMEATLGNALPDRVLEAEAALTRNTADAQYHYEVDTPVLNLWRDLLGRARVNEEDEEVQAHTLTVNGLRVTVGLCTTASINTRKVWTMSGWDDGAVLGWAVPDPTTLSEHAYVGVLRAPDDVQKAAKAAGEALDMDEATMVLDAMDAVRRHETAAFFAGTRDEVLGHILTEYAERYLTDGPVVFMGGDGA